MLISLAPSLPWRRQSDQICVGTHQYDGEEGCERDRGGEPEQQRAADRIGKMHRHHVRATVLMVTCFATIYNARQIAIYSLTVYSLA
jgi:hypothetical protein